jgi:predicted RNA methylase
MNTVTEVLQNCTVEGNVIKLPSQQLDRKLYLDTAKKLELIGGKWKGGKVFGFVFSSNPTELLEQIKGGESRNLQKEFQYFPTPRPLAERLVEMAELDRGDYTILEPSAGQGAMLNVIVEKAQKPVYCFELMDINRAILDRNEKALILGDDFLTEIDPSHTLYGKFDRIIANPPFARNQDINHIYKMYLTLKKGGIMVSMASKHWTFSQNKKETYFRNWLERVGAEVDSVEAGAFKESGTNIETVIIKIKK